MPMREVHMLAHCVSNQRAHKYNHKQQHRYQRHPTVAAGHQTANASGLHPPDRSTTAPISHRPTTLSACAGHVVCCTDSRAQVAPDAMRPCLMTTVWPRVVPRATICCAGCLPGMMQHVVKWTCVASSCAAWLARKLLKASFLHKDGLIYVQCTISGSASRLQLCVESTMST